MNPMQIHRYCDVTQNNALVSPGLSIVKYRSFDTIPYGALVEVVIHNCIGTDFELSGFNVPSGDYVSWAGFTGIPIFSVKTLRGWLNGQNSFVAAISGGYGPSTNLTQGIASVCGIIPIPTEDCWYYPCDNDYVGQFQLLDGTGNAMDIPAQALPVYLPNPVTLGDEPGAPPTPTKYSGVATIASGLSSVAIPVTGLTTAGIVATITQQNNGASQTGLTGVCTAGTLTVSSNSLAPSQGILFYWQLAGI